MKPQPGLSKQISQESLGEIAVRIYLRSVQYHSSANEVLSGTRNSMGPFGASRNRG